MTNRIWGDEYRTTLVCIDTYEQEVPTGRFYNPSIPEGRQFHGLTQFLQEMEQLLDGMDLPKAFQSVRTFSSMPPPQTSLCHMQTQTGALATFSIRILFRQNASWQGSIVWLEGRQEQSFRSVLELVMLVSNALALREVS